MTRATNITTVLVPFINPAWEDDTACCTAASS